MTGLTRQSRHGATKCKRPPVLHPAARARSICALQELSLALFSDTGMHHCCWATWRLLTQARDPQCDRLLCGSVRFLRCKRVKRNCVGHIPDLNANIDRPTDRPMSTSLRLDTNSKKAADVLQCCGRSRSAHEDVIVEVQCPLRIRLSVRQLINGPHTVE